MLRIFMAIVFTSQALLLSACVGNVIPKELEKQVDRSISFAQIKQNPDQYRGHLVVVGGEVLSIKRSPGDPASRCCSFRWMVRWSQRMTGSPHQEGFWPSPSRTWTRRHCHLAVASRWWGM